MRPSRYREDIQCVYQGSDKVGNIYIGNLEAARNLMTLQKYNIRAVVSAARGTFLKHSSEHLPNYLYIPVEDTETSDLSTHFDRTFLFIEKNLKRTNVLVHCVAGVSRSPSVVIAYLMKKSKLSFEECFRRLMGQRAIISPNEGFVKQLVDYGKTLNHEHPLGECYTEKNDRGSSPQNAEGIEEERKIGGKNKYLDGGKESLEKRIDRLRKRYFDSKNPKGFNQYTTQTSIVQKHEEKEEPKGWTHTSRKKRTRFSNYQGNKTFNI